MKKPLALILSLLLALGLFAACGSAQTPTEAPAETQTPTEAPAATEPPAETETPPHSAPANGTPGGVATAEDMTAVEEVVEEGMVPVYAGSLVDGVWPVTMVSSSSMFKADHCELVVENGAMSVILYMTSDAYTFMFAGTAAEAAAADKADDPLIPAVNGTFTLPLAALDDGESFAAYSRRKELWYDRTLLFRADSLPAEAFAEGFFTTAESLGLADGEYTVAVALSGGSGKASVSSPAKLIVAGGLAAAEIVWSSPNYDYMRVDDEIYLPTNTEGNSTFMVEVPYFDRPATYYADTTAMSQPHEIEYTLTFDSATIEAAG